MEIKAKSNGISNRDLFKLTEGKNNTNVRDAVGLQVKVSKWVIYEDDNFRGEPIEVLSIMGEDGAIYTTVSDVFKRSFDRILTAFPDDEVEIIILEGQTKAGRNYYDCTIV